MPQAAPRPCTFPGCGVLVHGASRCANHPHVNTFADKHRGSRHERGYGSAWDKLRLVVLRRDNYLCQPCAERGDVTAGRDVDHKVNKSQGGTDDLANLQTICPACHRAKTAQEAQQGRGT